MKQSQAQTVLNQLLAAYSLGKHGRHRFNSHSVAADTIRDQYAALQTQHLPVQDLMVAALAIIGGLLTSDHGPRQCLSDTDKQAVLDDLIAQVASAVHHIQPQTDRPATQELLLSLCHQYFGQLI